MSAAREGKKAKRARSSWTRGHGLAWWQYARRAGLYLRVESQVAWSELNGLVFGWRWSVYLNAIASEKEPPKCSGVVWTHPHLSNVFLGDSVGVPLSFLLASSWSRDAMLTAMRAAEIYADEPFDCDETLGAWVAGERVP